MTLAAATATGTILDNDGPLSNNAPVFAQDSTSRSIAETVGAAQDTGRDIGAAVTATDADNDALTYSLEGTDAASFEIVAASGQLRTKAGETYDREAKASYSVTVKATDPSSANDTIDVTIDITNVSEPPLAPGTPTVVAKSGTTDTLTATWTAPGNAGRPAITGYDLRYKLSTATSWTDGPQDVAAGTLTAEIGSLTSGAQYEAQARASNVDGDGPWSASGTGSTPPAQATAGGVTVYVFNLPSGPALSAAALANSHASRTPPAGKALETGPVDVSLSHPLSGGQQVTLCMPGTGELARHDGTQWNIFSSQSTMTIEGSAAACATVTEFSPFAVLADAAPANTPPTASIDANQETSANSGEIVYLSGVGSDTETADADLTFLWTQTGGTPTVALNLENTATANFNAPDVNSDTDLTFRLTVTDEGGLSDTADVTVMIKGPDAPSGKTEIWRATLTVGNLGTSWGYQQSSGYGAVSPNTFSFNGTDYTVSELNRSTFGGINSLNFQPNATLGAGNFILSIGGVENTFDGETHYQGTPAIYHLNASRISGFTPLTFVDGDSVEVILYQAGAAETPPTASGTIPNITMATNGIQNVDVASYFTGTVDSYTARSSDETKATVAVSNTSMVTVTGVAVGTATITVTATNSGGSAMQTFTVTVTAVAATPVITVTAVNTSVAEGQPVVFTLTATPPPGASLMVNFHIAFTGNYVTGVSAGPKDRVIGVGGAYTLTLLTTDDGVIEPDGSVTVTLATGTGYTLGNPATASVTVTDNGLPPAQPPVASGTIPVASVAVGAMRDVDVSGAFTGTVVTYAAVSGDETRATVAVSGSTVTVTGVAVGTATITVTATGGGATATQTFTVTVTAPPPDSPRRRTSPPPGRATTSCSWNGTR